MTERLAAALAAHAERNRIAAELATKQWTRSEVDAITRSMQSAGDTDGLKDLFNAVAAAERDGRVTEDTRATRQNIAARIAPDAWRMSESELAAFLKWAGTQGTEAANSAFQIGAELATNGAVFADNGLGTLYGEGCPDWAWRALNANFEPAAPATDAGRIAANLQRERFASMEAGWKRLLECRAAGQPHAWEPGHAWEPVDAANIAGRALTHGQASRKAQTTACDARAEQARAEVAAATRAARDALPGEQRDALERAEAETVARWATD